MLVYPEIYGADADNNRGQLVTYAEIEPSDSDEIKYQLEMMYEPDISIYSIFLYSHQFDTEHEFEVDINDYLTPEEIKGLT